MDSAGRIYKPELMFCNGIKISNRGIKCVHRDQTQPEWAKSVFLF